MTKLLRKNDLIQYTEYAQVYFTVIEVNKKNGYIKVKHLIQNGPEIFSYPNKYIKKVPKLKVSQIKQEILLLTCLRLQFKQKWWKYNHTKKQLPAWGKSYKLYKQLIKKYYVQ